MQAHSVAVASFRKEVKQSAYQFAEGDLDGNSSLSFEEFIAYLPSHIRSGRSPQQLRELFESADSNGDGVLTVSEFFMLALCNAATKFGAEALASVFAANGPATSTSSTKSLHKAAAAAEGLDLFQLEAVCKDLGFGAHSQEIFRALSQSDGKVRYSDIQAAAMAAMASSPATSAVDATRLEAEEKERLSVLEHALRGALSGWDMDDGVQSGDDMAANVAKLHAELRAALASSGAHVDELLGAIFDSDAGCVHGRRVDDVEFASALRQKLSYCGPVQLANEVFERIDVDGGRAIGYDELFEFVRGRRHALDRRSRRARQLRLALPDGAEYGLDDIAWDVATLRDMIQLMLERAEGTSSADLLRLWDSDSDHRLVKAEFLRHLERLFPADTVLWQAEVRSVASAAFAQIAGGADHAGKGGYARKVDIAELEAWLQAGSMPFSQAARAAGWPRLKSHAEHSSGSLHLQADQRTSARNGAMEGAALGAAAAVPEAHVRYLVTRMQVASSTLTLTLP